MQISDLLKYSTQQLAETSGSPRLDAEILLAYSLQKPRSFLYTWPEHIPTPSQLKEYESHLKQRQSGQPIAYLTGYREFWGMALTVTPDTLIPRPDTELLIETVLQYVSHQQTLNILDLGTGSGAIAIALASELPKAVITATDKSATALAIAQHNAKQHQQRHIRFILSDWFSGIASDERFDLIISNPPYIAENDEHLTQGDVRFEPRTALASGPDGLDDIRHLIKHAPNYLAEGGWLMLEHGYDQATVVKEILQQNDYEHTHCLQDLAGNDRVSCGQPI